MRCHVHCCDSLRINPGRHCRTQYDELATGSGEHPFKTASSTIPALTSSISSSTKASDRLLLARSGRGRDVPGRSSPCQPFARRAVAGSGPPGHLAKNRRTKYIHRVNSQLAPPRQPTKDFREGVSVTLRATRVPTPRNPEHVPPLQMCSRESPAQVALWPRKAAAFRRTPGPGSRCRQ